MSDLLVVVELLVTYFVLLALALAVAVGVFYLRRRR